MTIYSDWRAKQDQTSILRHQLDSCDHFFRVSDKTTTISVDRMVYSQMDGYALAQGKQWAIRSERTCNKCGLIQESIQIDPNDKLFWKEWHG